MYSGSVLQNAVDLLVATILADGRSGHLGKVIAESTMDQLRRELRAAAKLERNLDELSLRDAVLLVMGGDAGAVPASIQMRWPHLHLALQEILK